MNREQRLQMVDEYLNNITKEELIDKLKKAGYGKHAWGISEPVNPGNKDEIIVKLNSKNLLNLNFDNWNLMCETIPTEEIISKKSMEFKFNEFEKLECLLVNKTYLETKLDSYELENENQVAKPIKGYLGTFEFMEVA
ncbi:hypothetical protein [Methanococcus maripaludis]|uniref:Uncharacterized protein n=1 Tax=Methanococcus maripaludis TaxID=39152 RepID=A0A8T4H2K4_METMI|nr:hypothetical protein [Methanococcus maripaludis]MBM7408791.1 hypothetical protein [Methanococcus maripaludis]MBP2219040.1 hypothetical protein [Methanococcus maripaludis]